MSRFERGRLLVTLDVAGAVQMGWDRSLLDAAERERVAPTLRFSTWKPGAVSLGRFQDPERTIDAARVAAAGLDLVRRPTGGRAVLHLGDLTYTLVARRDDPILGATRRESLRTIGEALAGGISRLGLAVTLKPSRRGDAISPGARPPCFDSAAREELRAAGRKILGSARLEGRHAFLQHGSIALFRSPAEIAPLLGGSDSQRDEAYRRLVRASHSLREAAGRPVELEALVSALHLGFEDRVGRRFDREEPSAAELGAAARLAPDFALGVAVGGAA